MSELQKFENSEKFRTILRNFLLKENKPQEKKKNEDLSPRYSYDVSEDLKRLIEERKQRKMAERAVNVKPNYENKENTDFNQERVLTKRESLTPFKFNEINGIDDSLMDDASFIAMESICNKTTTFEQYLKSDHEIKKAIKQERKEAVSENNKHIRNELSQSGSDLDTTAVNRLVNSLHIDVAFQSALSGDEVTQIEDIEAPSRFWEIDFRSEAQKVFSDEMTQIEDIEAPSRFFDETIGKTSPVKMVGLLRPSTILECAETSDISSTQASFKSAAKYPFSEISSSCYETASDTMSFCKQEVNAAGELDLQVTIKEEPSTLQGLTKASIKVENLIDLTTDVDKYDETEESVIEVLSDDEPAEDQNSIALIKFEEQHSIALIKFEDETLNAANDEKSEQDISGEGSLHFNDTLEEVEYMMQKGLEYMAGAGLTPKQSPFKPQTLPSSQIETSAKPILEVPKIGTELSSPARSSRNSPLKSEHRFALDFKKPPKLEIFKKPVSANKSAVKAISRSKDKFAHVVSPICTYIKKTPEARLMSGVKTGSDDKNSSVFRELDFESRKYKPNFVKQKAELPKSPTTRCLPKIAYIASEYRQVVDERNSVTIPGKGLTKYLDVALLPSVIQHDGKANLANMSPVGTKLSQLPRREETQIQNDSFANLPIVTGDVSLYTIKDAQKL